VGVASIEVNVIEQDFLVHCIERSSNPPPPAMQVDGQRL
jgi:hypothetical protein